MHVNSKKNPKKSIIIIGMQTKTTSAPPLFPHRLPASETTTKTRDPCAFLGPGDLFRILHVGQHRPCWKTGGTLWVERWTGMTGITRIMVRLVLVRLEMVVFSDIYHKNLQEKGLGLPKKRYYIMIYIIDIPWGYSLNMNTAEYWLKWWLHMATFGYIYILNFRWCVEKFAKKLAEGLVAHLTWEGDDGGQWGFFAVSWYLTLYTVYSPPDIFLMNGYPPPKNYTLVIGSEGKNDLARRLSRRPTHLQDSSETCQCFFFCRCFLGSIKRQRNCSKSCRSDPWCIRSDVFATPQRLGSGNTVDPCALHRRDTGGSTDDIPLPKVEGHGHVIATVWNCSVNWGTSVLWGEIDGDLWLWQCFDYSGHGFQQQREMWWVKN